MKILGDSQILLFEELFSHLGETARYIGREVTEQQLKGVDALITRSTLNVNQSLLANYDVKFVGTCTIGTDHFDTDYLNRMQIEWTNAAGCNANSVAQYVLSAMAQLEPDWMQKTVGIIACGNIGGRVYRRLKTLGVNCRVYDPYLLRKSLSVSDVPDLTTLDKVLQADIITLHAPLTHDGDFPTYHLLNEQLLEQLKPNTVLISAGRGAVVDNQALYRRLSRQKDLRVALDVWEDEPNIFTPLIPFVDIATPHIAGHSIEGKEMGTVMVYEQLCRFLNIQPPVSYTDVITREKEPLVIESSSNSLDAALDISPHQRFNQLLLAVYPIMDDDQRLREWALQNEFIDGQSIASHFDSLRKNYPVRHEYSHFTFSDWAHQPPFNGWLSALTT